MYPGQTFDFTHDGREFCATIHADVGRPAPWDNEYGHGPVREIRTREEKKPGERILGDGPDRRTRGYAYDVQAAQAQALADGRGFEGEKTGMTKRQIAAEAVRQDFAHLEGWVRGSWEWIGVGVQALDAEGEPMGDEYAFALWGIESNVDDYIRNDVAPELAGELIANTAKHVYAGATVGEC